MIPGELRIVPGQMELSPHRERTELRVLNTGDRPIQVGSHFHFAQTNSSLNFNRDQARGFRLDILAGTSVRFEPGMSRDVVLVRLGGSSIVPGLQIKGPREG